MAINLTSLPLEKIIRSKKFVDKTVVQTYFENCYRDWIAINFWEYFPLM